MATKKDTKAIAAPKSGSTNFQYWNPMGHNQESDSAYATDAMRLNGASAGAVFPSATANKLFYQLAIMVAAIASMMAGKGYTMSDADGNNLATALSNILTNADLSTNFNAGGALTQGTPSAGHIKFPVVLGGLIIQWGNVLMPGGGSSDNPTPFNFDITFPNACLVCIPGTLSSTADRITFIKSVSTSGGVMSNNGSAANAVYIAIGY